MYSVPREEFKTHRFRSGLPLHWLSLSLFIFPFMSKTTHGQVTMIVNSPPTLFGDDERIEPGTHLNVFDGGILGDNFVAPLGSRVDVYSGEIGKTFRASGMVDISGGFIGDFFFVDESQIEISGGTLGDFFFVAPNGQATISGGTLGKFFTVADGGLADISGGSFDSGFSALEGSAVNLYGSHFALDGVDVIGLSLGQSFVIETRDVELTGLLNDGLPFGFNLNSMLNPVEVMDFFDPRARLSITVVPEPSGLVLVFSAVITLLVRYRSRVVLTAHAM